MYEICFKRFSYNKQVQVLAGQIILYHYLRTYILPFLLPFAYFISNDNDHIEVSFLN